MYIYTWVMLPAAELGNEKQEQGAMQELFLPSILGLDEESEVISNFPIILTGIDMSIIMIG